MRHHCCCAVFGAAALLLLGTAAALSIRMAPEQLLVYDSADGGLSPGFSGDADNPDAAWEDAFQSYARFVIETDPAEFYAAPTLRCEAGCPGAADPRVDDSEAGAGDVGNVDPAMLAEYFEDGSLLELIVWYRCAPNATADADVLLNVTLQLLEPPSEAPDFADDDDFEGDADGSDKPFTKPLGPPISFLWHKTCAKAGTLHRGVSVSLDGETPVVVDGAALAEFAKGAPEFVVGADETSTEFMLEATEGNFVWDAPVVSVRPLGSVSVDKAGSAAEVGYAEVNEGFDPPSLVLMYSRCDVPRATVTVSWKMPPFSPIEFSFVKVCGGGPAPGFDVTVNLPAGAKKGISEGRAIAPFVEAKELLSPADGATTMWVTANSPVNVLRVHVSQSPAAIFRAELSGDLASTTGTQLSGDSSLLLKYACERQGTAKVTVTFQLAEYRSAALSFTKQCAAPSKAKKQKSSWSPTGVVLGVSAGGIVIGTIAALWRAAGNPTKVRPRRRDPADAL